VKDDAELAQASQLGRPEESLEEQKALQRDQLTLIEERQAA
jgi:hypothetical protein